MKKFYPYPKNGLLCACSKIYFVSFILLLFSLNLFAQPAINSFAPVSGTVGTTVIISGTNFNANAANNIVFFGAVKANVIAATATSLSVTVPTGATYQPITVTVNNLTAYSSKPFIVTFSGGTQLILNPDGTQNCFEAKIDSTTDFLPNSVAVADFDGDGIPDLATPNNYSIAGQPASVSVLRNISSAGKIAFDSHKDMQTGTLTYSIGVGDLNGDGKPDLVSGSISDQTISIFRNTSVAGAISFASKIDLATGYIPSSISIADIDRDGKPDVVIANSSISSMNYLSVFRNTSVGGVISFATRMDIAITYFIESLAVGDIDGDTKPDIVMANGISNNISIFRNISSTGAISFSPKIDFAAGINVVDVAIADLDGDNKNEVVTANNGSSTFSILHNTSTSGNISFVTKQDFNCGFSPYSVTIGDINGDARPEIVVPSYNLGVSQNNCTPGNISFGSMMYLFLSPTINHVGIVDLTRDGKADLAGSLFSGNAISLIRNKNNEPTLRSIYPNAAVSGDTIIIEGFNLAGVTSVLIGGVPAVSFEIVDSKTIRAVVGAGISGDITVTNPYGTHTLGGFIYAAPPTISSFSPTAASQGDSVTITGTNFTNVNAVSFGGISAISFIINSPTSISAIVGTGASGSIALTNTYGTGTRAGFFILPFIESFSPLQAGKGMIITIRGNNFSGVTSVGFGGVPAASYAIISPTSISAVVGNGASGNVTVANSKGTGKRSGFIYIPAPVINLFTPVAAGTDSLVTIKGSNFSNTSSVLFGGKAAKSFSVISDSIITAVVGNGATGGITIITPGGADTLYTFVYIPPPAITSFTPKVTGTGGVVTIIGTNLSGATSVSFGGVESSSFTVIDSVTIKAVVSSGASGTIKVVTGGGKSVSDLFTFTERPIINSFFPISGTVGSEVTITGANFNPLPENNFVYFGAVKASVFAASKNILKVKVPAGGVYQPVTVATGGLSAVSKIPFVITFPGEKDFTRNTFSGKMEFQTGAGPRSIASADINGDGKIDLVTTNSLDNSISIFKNKSSLNLISFSPKMDIEGGPGPYFIAVADLDNDGKLDIITFNHSGGNYTGFIFRNTSNIDTITFAPKLEFLTNHHPGDIAIGDLNADGRPDICIANTFIKTNGVGLNMTFNYNNSDNGVISFMDFAEFNQKYVITHEFSPIYSDQFPMSVCTGDMDDDGISDLAIGYANDYYNNSITIYTPKLFNDKKDIQETYFNPNKHVRIGDFDVDGRLDIISDYTIFRGEGDFSFQQQRITGITEVTAIGDLNGDGKPDFVNGNSNSSSVSVSGNTTVLSSISFSPKTDYATGNAPTGVVIADIDGDGKPEIAVSNYNDNTISVLRNQAGSGIIEACTGSPITFPSETKGTKYQWQINSGGGFINIVGNSNYSGTITDTLQLNSATEIMHGYSYRCIVNDTIIGKSFVLKVKAIEAPLVAITASANPACDSSSVTFSAKTPNGGTDARYQWQINGTNNNNNGYNNSIFSSNLLKDKDNIQVILTSNASCLSSPEDTSNTIEMNVMPLLRYTGSIKTSSESCIDNAYYLIFTGVNTPYGSSIRPYEIYSNSYTPVSDIQIYAGAPLSFEITNSTVGEKEYFFKITAPASGNCDRESFTDTATIIIKEKLATPVITGDNTILTISNYDSGAFYRWQMLETGNIWNDIVPEDSGSTYTARISGTYRVTVQKGACIGYSNTKAVIITAIDPVSAASLGIRFYPNPTSGNFTIDTLKLTDKWETLEIFDTHGKQKLTNFNIRNKTRVDVSVEYLSNGFYIAILKRRNGPATVLKFLKL